MGLLNKFKKEKNGNIQRTQEKSPYQLLFSKTKDDKVQLDFYDGKANFKQFYDTTRLIINRKIQIKNTILTEALISYYSENDAIMINKDGQEFGRRVQYEKILMDVDTNLLQRNSNYCNYVMKNLLNKERVDEYLKRGLQENSEQPCGNYVGGVRTINNGYRKVFDPIVGKMVHESLEMKQKREEDRERQEQQKQDNISKRKSEIERLQREIEDMQK